MAVIITSGPPSYNKGAKPSKIPPKEVYPTHKFVEGHEIWVSVPRPDKLHLIGDLLPEHFGNPSEKDELGPLLMAALASGAVAKVLDTTFTGKIYFRVQIGVPPKEAPVFFELRKAPAHSPAAHQLIVQFNPARLGQEGVFELLDRLNKFTPHKLNVGKFLAGARVSRLDIAVDLVGLAVCDVIASVGPAGKEVHYLSDELETVSFHRKLKFDQSGQLSAKGKLNPLGELLVSVYDKRRQQIAMGEPPPFGNADVTRVELSKRRFGNKPFSITSLPNLKNPLGKIKVGLVQSAGPEGSWKWLRYIEARRGGGHEKAVEVNQLSLPTAKDFAQRYTEHPADVIAGKEIWAGWQQGIEATGLNYMIEAAEQLSAGVPLPIETDPCN